MTCIFLKTKPNHGLWGPEWRWEIRVLLSSPKHAMAMTVEIAGKDHLAGKSGTMGGGRGVSKYVFYRTNSQKKSFRLWSDLKQVIPPRGNISEDLFSAHRKLLETFVFSTLFLKDK